MVGGSTYFRTHPLVLVSLFKGLASAAWYHCTPLPLTSQAQSPPASSVAATTTAASLQAPSQPPCRPTTHEEAVPVVLRRLVAAHTPI